MLKTLEDKTVFASRPREWTMSNAKIVRRAFHDDFKNKQWREISIINKPSNLNAIVQIDYENLKEEGLRIKEELTPYDKIIYNAITSLWIENKDKSSKVCITPQMIYRTMTSDFKARLTKIERNNIFNSILKMLHTWITIEGTSELSEKIGRFEYHAALLAGSWCKIKFAENDSIECLRLLDTPVLFSMSDKLNQIIRVPTTLLKSKLNYTSLEVKLRDYLISRIEIMKNKKNRICSKDILYNSIYDNILLEMPSKKQKEKIQEKLIRILNDFIEKEYIENYKVVKKGRKNHKISIII